MLDQLGLQWERYRRLKRLDPSAPRAPNFPAQLRIWCGDESYRDFLANRARHALGGRRSNPSPPN
jgi:hypothetical protein